MAKHRAPTSKSSWIGMAAHKIDEITTFGARHAARHARELADAVARAGKDLLSIDPRSLARANYSPEAIQAQREAAEARQRKNRQILGEDGFAAWLRGAAPSRSAAGQTA